MITSLGQDHLLWFSLFHFIFGIVVFIFGYLFLVIKLILSSYLIFDLCIEIGGVLEFGISDAYMEK